MRMTENIELVAEYRGYGDAAKYVQYLYNSQQISDVAALEYIEELNARAAFHNLAEQNYKLNLSGGIEELELAKARINNNSFGAIHSLIDYHAIVKLGE